MSEYIILEDMISSVSLTPSEDVQSSMFEKKNGYLDSALIYRTSTYSGVRSEVAKLQVHMAQPRPTKSKKIWMAASSEQAAVPGIPP